MIARLILVTIVMAAGSFVLRVDRVPFYYIIAIFYLATFIYAVLLKINFPVYLHVYLQIIVDIILETVTIHYAGGADSVYAFLYAPSIIAGGVVISGTAAKTMAGISGIFYGAISGLEFFGIIHPVPGAEELYNRGVYEVMFVVSFRIIIFCLIGYLSSYLARELKREHIKLELILKNIASGVLTLNAAGRIVYANPPAQRMLGMRKGGILYTYWPNLLWEEPDADVINRFITQAKSTSGSEIDIIKPDGKKLILCFSYNELFDKKKKAIGGILTFVDLTALKELELEIRQREKLSAMGEMAIGIAHEIRNPLGSIRGALELLKEKGGFQKEAGKLVDVIFKESDRLNRTIEDFLTFTKERKPSIKYEDLGKLVDEVWLLVRQEERWHGGIKMEKTLNLSQIVAEIDPDQMKQVFYNLFINSIEACRDKQEGKIQVDIKEEAQKVTIIIKDNGIGIPKEEIGKLFQRFYSTKSYGLGIGLSITRRIIESHRGTITLQSQEGEGTTVTIVLPK